MCFICGLKKSGRVVRGEYKNFRWNHSSLAIIWNYNLIDMSTMLEGWGAKKRKVTNEGSREVSKSLWVYPKIKDLLMQNISEYYHGFFK